MGYTIEILMVELALEALGYIESPITTALSNSIDMFFSDHTPILLKINFGLALDRVNPLLVEFFLNLNYHVY
jgi:hypothetical protein